MVAPPHCLHVSHRAARADSRCRFLPPISLRSIDSSICADCQRRRQSSATGSLRSLWMAHWDLAAESLGHAQAPCLLTVCSQPLTVLSASHCALSLSLCSQPLTVLSASHCALSLSLCALCVLLSLCVLTRSPRPSRHAREAGEKERAKLSASRSPPPPSQLQPDTWRRIARHVGHQGTLDARDSYDESRMTTYR